MDYNLATSKDTYYHTKKVLDSKVDGQIINETVVFTGFHKGGGGLKQVTF